MSKIPTNIIVHNVNVTNQSQLSELLIWCLLDDSHKLFSVPSYALFTLSKPPKTFLFVCLFVLFRVVYLFAFVNKAQLLDQETYRKCIAVTLAWLLDIYLSWKVKQPCFLTTMHKCLNLSNLFPQKLGRLFYTIMSPFRMQAGLHVLNTARRTHEKCTWCV